MTRYRRSILAHWLAAEPSGRSVAEKEAEHAVIALAVERFLASGGIIERVSVAQAGGVTIDDKGRWRGQPQAIQVRDYKPVSHLDMFALPNALGFTGTGSRKKS